MTLPAEQTAIAATLTLEAGCLRASLRLEVELAHPAFSPECFLSDLRKSAGEILPIALSTAAPPALRQILEEAEGLLLERVSLERASFSPSMQTQYQNDITGA